MCSNLPLFRLVPFQKYPSVPLPSSQSGLTVQETHFGQFTPGTYMWGPSDGVTHSQISSPLISSLLSGDLNPNPSPPAIWFAVGRRGGIAWGLRCAAAGSDPLLLFTEGFRGWLPFVEVAPAAAELRALRPQQRPHQLFQWGKCLH